MTEARATELLQRHAPNWIDHLGDPQLCYEAFDAAMSCRSTQILGDVGARDKPTMTRYQRMKADPEKYKHRLEQNKKYCQAYYARQKAKTLAAFAG